VDKVSSLAIDGQGRIVVAGDAGSAPATSDAGILRLLTDGHLDKSFAGDGTLVYDTAVEVRVHDVAVQDDGKIVIGAGWGSYPTVDTMIQRFKENGVADTTFAGGSPLLKSAVNGERSAALAVAVAPGGKIVSGGKTGESPGVRGVLMCVKGKPDPVAPPVSPPETTVPADAPLALSSLRLTNRLFAVGRARTPRVGHAQAAARRPRGTAFRFQLSRSATVGIRIKRLVTTRAGRRARAVALLKRTAQAGGNRVRFSGRVGRRALRPGRYRATLTAVDAAGKRSKPATVAFRVVRG
jgi:Domain of unknown function (DUF5122) beta-propeller